MIECITGIMTFIGNLIKTILEIPITSYNGTTTLNIGRVIFILIIIGIIIKFASGGKGDN